MIYLKQQSLSVTASPVIIYEKINFFHHFIFGQKKIRECINGVHFSLIFNICVMSKTLKCIIILVLVVLRRDLLFQKEQIPGTNYFCKNEAWKLGNI